MAEQPKQYLSVVELAEQLGISPKTVKNKMAKGVFKLGVHYFKPPGLGPRFKWSAIVAWMEQSQGQTDTDSNVIPMPVHYRARESFGKNGLAS